LDPSVTRLSDRDYLAVLGAVREVSSVDTRDTFGPVVLTELNRLVRSDVTSLNEVDPVAARLVFLAEPATYVFPEGLDQVLAELAHQHPLIRHHADTGDGSARKISDLLDDAAWHETPIYQRFYRVLDVQHQMSITLPAPLPIVVGIALNRAQGDFDERDREVLNLVRPHLAQSWRRARDHERLEALLGAASDALLETGGGVVVLSDPVHELTAGALARLHRYFGPGSARDPLPAAVRRWLEDQLRGGDGPAGALRLAAPLRAALDERQLVLRHLPGTSGRDDAILLDEQPLDPPTETLRNVGLTDREVIVVRLLSSGATNAEIGKRLSISPWTVKRHLANIYAKLGVNGRVRAAAMAIELDAHHRPRGE
jgi:DNA-binding CsgD family transcriptional regulator